MYRCDQDIITRLNIAYVVLKEYKKDGSSVSMLAVIMGSLITEVMVKFCKENSCQLIRYYDFYETCK